MSKNTTSLSKPLKGQVFSGIGDFSNLTATTIKLPTDAVNSLMNGILLSNVIITNSEINNSIIGAGGNNAAVFTSLETTADVTFTSIDQQNSVYWNSVDAILQVNADFAVDGCATISNIQICGNTLMPINTNGDINIVPNRLGTVNLNGPVNIQTTSFGNFTTNLTNGNITFTASDFINLTSKKDGLNATTLLDQNYNLTNGDFNITTDLGSLSTKTIVSLNSTVGGLLVTLNTKSNLLVGDTVSFTSSSIGYTGIVSSIPGTTGNVVFITTGSVITSNTSGTGFLVKELSNNVNISTTILNLDTNTINLNSVGNIYTTSGTSGGIVLSNTVGNITFNTANDLVILNSSGTRNNFYIPSNTRVSFGTTGNLIEMSTNGSLSINSDVLEINSTNVKVQDPNIIVGNYPSTFTDLSDRGVQFYYSDTGGNMKLGWFGYKQLTGRFSFLTNASNNNEIITGTPGQFDIGNINVGNISLSGGNINMGCGELLNVATITSCQDLTIQVPRNIFVSSSTGSVFFTAANVNLPGNVPLNFGSKGTVISTNGNFVIRNDTASSLILGSGSATVNANDINLNTNTVNMNTNSKLFIGSSNYLVSNTSGVLELFALGNMQFYSSSGNYVFPSTSNLLFGSNFSLIVNSTGALLNSSSGSLSLTSQQDLLLSSNTLVKLASDTLVQTRLVFNTTSGPSIYSTNSNLFVQSPGNININSGTSSNVNISTSNVNIPENTIINLGTGVITNSNGNTSITSSSVSISATTTNLISNLNVVGNANFSSGNVNLISMDVNIQDPNPRVSSSFTDPSKDRGIIYTKDTSGNYGWFGYKQATGLFSFYSNAIETDNIISGTMGDFSVGSAFINGSLVFVSSGSLNMNCGTISNLRTIQSCSSGLDIISPANVLVSAVSVSLETANVKVPFNSKISFGTTDNSISTNTAGSMVIDSTTLVLNGNLIVNGTTQNVFSTVTNVQDPTISIGGVTGPVIADGYDRGIEFKWFDGSVSQIGFFGFQNSSQSFEYIPKATVGNNGVYSGSLGNVIFSNGSFTNLNLNSGTLSNVSVVTNNSGSGINIVTPIATFSQIVSVPGELNLLDTIIKGTTSGNLLILNGSAGSVFFTTGSVAIPTGSSFVLGNSSLNTTAGNLNINNSSGSINLSTANVNIPVNSSISLGSIGSLYSNSSSTVLGSNQFYINSTSANVSGNLITKDFVLDSTPYILPLGSNEINSISSITSTVGGILVTTNTPGYLSVGNTVQFRNTLIPSIDNIPFSVSSTIANNSFMISTATTIANTITQGYLVSNLTVPRIFDVGIQVSRNTGITVGSTGYSTGFFGWKNSLDRWVFYNNATISNNIVTGNSFGNIQIEKLFTNTISGFNLDGALNGGSFVISSSNLLVSGGVINGTPVGPVTASTGRFTTLTSTISSNLATVSITNTLTYTPERFTLSSGSETRNPSVNFVISFVSVNGVTLQTSGTMPSTSVADGQVKKIIASSIGPGCSYILHFGAGKLITPNPLGLAAPSKLTFKRSGQSCEIVFDDALQAWVITGGSAYSS